ncbi:MAG: YlxR family protein [Mariprofundales bacterium]
MKGGPQRSCDCCRSTMDKHRLLRLVCDDVGQWWPDLRQKASGRGKYLCMEVECLHRLNDRQVARVFGTGTSHALLLRIQEAIAQRLQALMHRMRGRAVLGKDAVLQALWQSAPLTIVVADDASAGLWDRVVQAVEKHCVKQSATQLLQMGTMAEFGAIYDRDRIAVMAWNRDVLTDKLTIMMGWRAHLIGVGLGVQK